MKSLRSHEVQYHVVSGFLHAKIFNKKWLDKRKCMIKAECYVKKISGKLPNSYKRPGKMGNIPYGIPPE